MLFVVAVTTVLIRVTIRVVGMVSSRLYANILRAKQSLRETVEAVAMMNRLKSQASTAHRRRRTQDRSYIPPEKSVTPTGVGL